MKDKILQMRLEDELHQQLKKLADSNALSVSSQVRMLIKLAVRKNE